MNKEAKAVVDAATKAGKKARILAQEAHYQFVEFENGILYKMVNGKKEIIKEIPEYTRMKESILNDKRLGW